MSASQVRWLPGPPLLLAAVLTIVMALISAARGMGDADLFWHLKTGQLILEGGGIPTSDPYSFTYGAAWTAHEWLGEAIIYLLFRWLGAGWTFVLFGAMTAAAVWIPALTMLRRGIRTSTVMAGAGIGALVLASYVTARPQVFSWLLLGGLVSFLLSVSPRHPARVLLLFPLFLVWANLHGLWVIGLATVALYALATLLGRTPLAAAPQGRTWILAGIGVAIAASAITPAGLAGLAYPLRYVQPGDWGLANISEWQSPNFHDLANAGLLLVAVASVVAGGRGVPGWVSALGIIGLAMALVSVRNGPIAAITAVPVISAGFDALLPHRPADGQPLIARRLMEAGLAIVIVIASVLVLGPRAAANADGHVEPSDYPVAAVDHLLQIDPDAHVFADYGWGGYLVYRLYDRGGRVFVDGRNDMYPRAVLDDYAAARAAHDGWGGILDRYGTDAILLPPDTPLVRAATSARWCVASQDAVAVLLLRECAAG